MNLVDQGLEAQYEPFHSSISSSCQILLYWSSQYPTGTLGCRQHQNSGSRQFTLRGLTFQVRLPHFFSSSPCYSFHSSKVPLTSPAKRCKLHSLRCFNEIISPRKSNTFSLQKCNCTLYGGMNRYNVYAIFICGLRLRHFSPLG